MPLKVPLIRGLRGLNTEIATSNPPYQGGMRLSYQN